MTDQVNDTQIIIQLITGTVLTHLCPSSRADDVLKLYHERSDICLPSGDILQYVNPSKIAVMQIQPYVEIDDVNFQQNLHTRVCDECTTVTEVQNAI